ncbi:hypothetical protein F3Y22_tig00111166pilonHSYRG00400 [Hibiscus syriacus]|uniref:RING-CH-type domain-containing protein n=1 Tax=Hibiscus syriacus TaxID=106335 RepID=A0A6A2YX87_HIBSY|nr:hypothetical protein F3Y22_tig00111166pilonHSYRG00400 [Hibiscus syriacus]
MRQSLKSTSSDDSVVKPPKQATPPSSSDHSLSSSNLDSHIQFDTDLKEEDVCRICRNPGDVENPLRYPCACSAAVSNLFTRIAFFNG